MLQNAQDQLARLETEISRCKIERDLFERRLRGVIDEHMILLELRKAEERRTGQRAGPAPARRLRSGMIEADLAVTGISELATPQGTTALAGSEMGRLRVVPDAAVASRAGKIVFVGTESEYHQAVSLAPDGRRVDAAGGTVLPGFVDAHTHLPFAGWREQEFDERLRGATYSEIAARGGGILSTVGPDPGCEHAELAEQVRGRLDDMLRLGTTTVEAKSGYGLSFEDELKQLAALRDAVGRPPGRVWCRPFSARTPCPSSTGTSGKTTSGC